MRDQKSGELEQLEKGLSQSKPLDDLLQQLARDNEVKELYAKGLYYVRWTGHMMAVGGIYFLALKEKVGHGHFKKMFIGKDKPLTYMHVWQCMKAATVVAEHPVFGKLRTSRAFLALMLLPAPEQKALANEMRDLPEEEINELLPGKIQKRYDELKREKRNNRPAKSKAPKPLPERNMDAAWVVVRERWGEAVAAIGHLKAAAESMQMKQEYFDEVFDNKWCDQLGRQLDRLSEILTPVEECRRRGASDE